MDENTLTEIISKSMEIGVFGTLNKMGLLPEKLTEPQAKKEYGKKFVEDWRSKKWITGYPFGDRKPGKVYYLRTELEIARRMVDVYNIIPANTLLK